MNTSTNNPCYELAPTNAPRRLMTAFVSPSLGRRLALANHLLSAVRAEDANSIVLHYGRERIRIEGKNLDTLFNHLVAHEVIVVRVFDKAHTPIPTDGLVESIRLLRPAKAAKPPATAVPASTASATSISSPMP